MNSLLDYIKGERYGEKAHRLEQEAIHDPFLQDAMDGYDLEDDDRPMYHLKKLKKQIKKRTRKNSHYLLWWSIAACAAIIICAGVFFFVFDGKNRIGFFKKTVYVEDFSDDLLSIDQIIDSLAAIKSTPKVVDTISFSAKIVNTKKEVKATTQTNQRVDLSKVKDRSIDRDEPYDEPSDYTLSNSDIQKILSEYNNDEDTKTKTTSNEDTKAKTTSNEDTKTKTKTTSNQTPKPVMGEKAYNDYIKKNRKPITNGKGENQHGTVILRFRVNENGRPVDISKLRSLNQAADQEAIRLLQSGPNWTVGDKAQLSIDF